MSDKGENEAAEDTLLLCKTAQEQMAVLFDRERSVITKHVANVFKEGELPQEGNVQNLHIATSTKPVKLYSLDVIISVGYRVKSQQGTRFRIWATGVLRDYLVKGFALDDNRIKENSALDRYFDELVERIRDIRTSERQFYRKVADIYATSVDYDPKSDLTARFYATVQNKSAAELIDGRADSSRPNMGLTNWNGERILARDVTVAKNYLSNEELGQLNSIVEQYLIFAESQAKWRISMKMVDWVTKLHGFLTLNDREILTHLGKVTKEVADAKALSEYRKYPDAQALPVAYQSDFDRTLGQLAPGRPARGGDQ